MKRIIFLLIIFLVGCGGNICEEYTSNGECCNYVCNKVCPNGYIAGTCNCECLGAVVESDSGIDDVFDDNDNIEPPVIPS